MELFGIVLFFGFIFGAPLLYRAFLRSKSEKSRIAAFLLEQDDKARARNKMILGTAVKIALAAAKK